MKNLTFALGTGVVACLSAAVMLWGAPGQAHAQARPGPPDVLAYEGLLVAPGGAPIGASKPSNYAVIFRVFDAATGGSLLWSEQQTVTVTQGRFQVLLGEGSVHANEPRPALSSVFASSSASDRYIEFTVRDAGAGGADATLSPRTRMVSGAYTMLATHARSARALVNAGGQAVLTSVEGRVGINRSNPTAMLHVAGDAMAEEVLTTTGGIANVGSVSASGFFGLGMAPVGSIVMWTGTEPPSGWVLCDGTVVAGVTTPDLRGRFILGSGAGAGLTPRAVGEMGGAETHALTQLEMPSHRHSVTSSATVNEMAEGTHGYRAAVASRFATHTTSTDDGSQANAQQQGFDTASGGAHRHRVEIPSFASASSGSGRPHNNMPPFYALAFIMRVQ